MRWLLLSIVFSVGWILLISGVNFTVDPYQFFRKSHYHPYLSGNQRYQNPGLAKHYAYDTIIVGTSTAENFVNSYVDKILGVKTLRLVMSGATAREENLIAQIAINTGKVKNILWGIDFLAFRKEYSAVRDENETDFPRYFYDQSTINDIKYLLNRDALDLSIKTVLDPRTYRGYGQSIEDRLSYLNNWNDQKMYSRKQVKVLWEDHKKNPLVNIFNPANLKRNYRENIKANVEELVRKNEKISFLFFFPPYSILFHRSWYEGNRSVFYEELSFKKLIYEELGHYPNVKIFDFQDLKWISHNLDNYKDFQHYSQIINQEIINNISAGKYLLNENNINERLNSLKDQVENFEENDVF